MSEKHIVQTMVEYHVASNCRLWEHILETLTDEAFTRELGYSHGSIRHQMVHLAVTDRYWLHDVQAELVTGLNPMDYPTREQFTPVFEETQQALLDYIRSLSDADLAEVPDGLTVRRDEALAHVVNHGTDHRAQMLSMLYTLGAPTFEQDLPNFLRGRRRLSKEEVLNLVRFRRQQWDEILASIPEEKMVECSIGDWSIKDILAHLTWHDREMTIMLQNRNLSASPWWDLPLEERNHNIFEQHRHLPMEDVIQRHDRVYQALLDEIEQLDNEDINDPARIENMLAGYKLWMVLEEKICNHYLQHTESVLAWLESPAFQANGPVTASE